MKAELEYYRGLFLKTLSATLVVDKEEIDLGYVKDDDEFKLEYKTMSNDLMEIITFGVVRGDTENIWFIKYEKHSTKLITVSPSNGTITIPDIDAEFKGKLGKDVTQKDFEEFGAKYKAIPFNRVEGNFDGDVTNIFVVDNPVEENTVHTAIRKLQEMIQFITKRPSPNDLVIDEPVDSVYKEINSRNDTEYESTVPSHLLDVDNDAEEIVYDTDPYDSVHQARLDKQTNSALNTKLGKISDLNITKDSDMDEPSEKETTIHTPDVSTAYESTLQSKFIYSDFGGQLTLVRTSKLKNKFGPVGEEVWYLEEDGERLDTLSNIYNLMINGMFGVTIDDGYISFTLYPHLKLELGYMFKHDIYSDITLNKLIIFTIYLYEKNNDKSDIHMSPEELIELYPGVAMMFDTVHAHEDILERSASVLSNVLELKKENNK